MIKLFGRLFWNIVRTRLSGPENADRPILVLVEEDAKKIDSSFTPERQKIYNLQYSRKRKNVENN